MSKVILITGASGYIGSHLAQRLSQHYPVIEVDIRPPQQAAGTYFQCDIRDPQLAELIRDHRVSHVIHLASVLESSGDEQRDYDIDVNGTRNVVNACLANGVQQLIVTSSGAAYGYHPDSPAWLDEEDPLRGNAEIPYARHKYLVEQYLADVRQTHPALTQLILRPGTVLGKHTRNQITNLFEKKQVLGICGSPSPFVFIWDEDLIAVIEKGLLEERGGIYNLAGDGALTIDEVAARLQKRLIKLPAGLVRFALYLGRALRLSRYAPEQIKFLRYRPVLSNRRLKEEFGYQPQLSSAQTFELFLKHARQRGQL